MGLAEFIVAFREIFEIALVVGIMLAYLGRTKNMQHAKTVYAGAALAAVASAVAAWAFQALVGGFEGHDQLFEGTLLIASTFLVTWLILWMFSQKDYSKKIEEGVRERIGRREEFGLAAFAFVTVLREGVELAIFLWGIFTSTGALDLGWAAAGGAAAVCLCYAVLKHAVRLDMRAFFTYTAALLILLAAGLLSQGVHELQEAGVVPTSFGHIYDITPPMNPDGTYPLMHEEGAVGSVLKGLVGYSTAPTLEQAAAYASYVALAYFFYRRISGSRR